MSSDNENGGASLVPALAAIIACVCLLSAVALYLAFRKKTNGDKGTSDTKPANGRGPTAPVLVNPSFKSFQSRDASLTGCMLDDSRYVASPEAVHSTDVDAQQPNAYASLAPAKARQRSSASHPNLPDAEYSTLSQDAAVVQPPVTQGDQPEYASLGSDTYGFGSRDECMPSTTEYNSLNRDSPAQYAAPPPTDSVYAVPKGGNKRAEVAVEQAGQTFRVPMSADA